jgi:hypothetical protein
LFALVAEIVTAYVPAVLGTPLIKPEVALTDKPGGRPVALKLVGPFVAPILYVR